MTTVELRRYGIESGRMADFLAWFPSLVPVREKYGFGVSFALADHEHDSFIWAVSYDGDVAAFERAVAAYHSSPERAAVFESFPGCVTGKEIGFVDDVLGR